MKKEHERILKILNKIKNKEDANLILKLKRIIENHLFIEEKFIFKIAENIEILEKLIKQHKEILWLLEKNDEENFRNLKKLLIEHINLELKDFYPNLDKKLDEREKCMIINDIEKCKVYF